MSRREEENSAVSLFAFQDVITSISGIMFLIVLLLVITMLTNYLSAASAALTPELIELAAEAERLQSLAEKLSLNSREQEQKLAELRKLAPEELAQRIKKLQYQIQQTQQMFQQQELQLKEMTRQADTTARKSVELAQTLQNMTHQTREQTEKLQSLEQQLKAAKRQFIRQQKLLKYAIKESSGKIPVLLELGSDGIQLLNTATQQKLDLRTPSSADSLQKLQSALVNFDRTQYYFSTAVKPGGFAMAPQVLTMLKAAGFERGFEIIPQDSVSLFPEDLP